MKRDDRWNVLNAGQEKNVTLSTTVQELKDSNLKLTQAYTTSTGKHNINKRQFDDKFAWKKLPPKGKEPKTKDKNGKTYHWCFNH